MTFFLFTTVRTLALHLKCKIPFLLFKYGTDQMLKNTQLLIR